MNNDTKAGNQVIPNILVVDDIAESLRLLADILKAEGYKVRPVPDGELALQAAEKEKPDLILLDIMMPGIDGFEVCRRLKEDSGLKDIPVIFISSLSNSTDIVKALTKGGVDYISKPFKAEEVLARVGTHLKLSRQSKELQELNSTKDKFFSIIAHDLRGPLGGFMALSEMMANESYHFSDEENKKMAITLSESARNTYKLLENLLEWSLMERKMSAFNPQILILKKVIDECINIAAESARVKYITVVTGIIPDHPVFADTNMIMTVIRNLLSNGIKFTPAGGNVTISAQQTGNKMMRISVKDSGIGMSDQMSVDIFRIDVNTKRPGTNDEPSTGLGLLICKEFVEKNGGKISVESVHNEGSVFHFTLPCLQLQS
jgi:signal transduction histidine kinase